MRYVETVGEISCMYYGNKLSNIVQKQAVKGDYRVMDDFGGTDRKAKIDRDGEDVCIKALAAIPFEDVLYARVDLMRDNDGKWIVTELECIEPSLFFRHS